MEISGASWRLNSSVNVSEALRSRDLLVQTNCCSPIAESWGVTIQQGRNMYMEEKKHHNGIVHSKRLLSNWINKFEKWTSMRWSSVANPLGSICEFGFSHFHTFKLFMHWAKKLGQYVGDLDFEVLAMQKKSSLCPRTKALFLALLQALLQSLLLLKGFLTLLLQFLQLKPYITMVSPQPTMALWLWKSLGMTLEAGDLWSQEIIKMTNSLISCSFP